MSKLHDKKKKTGIDPKGHEKFNFTRNTKK